MEKTITLNWKEYLALCSVVDYLHDDELKHYEEEPSSKHIWHNVKTLSLKLEEHKQICVDKVGDIIC